MSERGRRPQAEGFGLVVPVFDEEQRLAEYGKPLVDFIADQPPGSELVFVDDGSTDGTAEPGRGADHRRPRRRRCGSSAAPTRARGRRWRPGWPPRAAYAGVLRPRPVHPARPVRAGAARRPARPVLAIGSRDLATSRLLRPEGRVREALGRTYNRLLQATLTPGHRRHPVRRQGGGPGGVGAVLPHCHETGYAWDAEVIAVARALGIAVQEVPIDWRHDERSKVRLARDGAAMVWATRRIWRSPDAAAGAGEAPRAAGRAAGCSTTPTPSCSWRPTASTGGSAARRPSWPPPCAAPARRPPATAGWSTSGAGAGGVTAMLGWDPARVVVVEGSELLVRRAGRRRARRRAGRRRSAAARPTASSSVVCLLDVIEHLADPVGALTEAAACARSGRTPGGERARPPVAVERGRRGPRPPPPLHPRRPCGPNCVEAGFEPIVLTHVFSWLVPPVWLTRRSARPGQAELGLDQTSPLVDRAAMVLTLLERASVGQHLAALRHLGPVRGHPPFRRFFVALALLRTADATKNVR